MLHADLSASTLELFSMAEAKHTRRLSSQMELDSFNAEQDLDLNIQALEALGGIPGIEESLRTSFSGGISTRPDDIEMRQREFGTNFIPEPEPKTWISIFLGSFEDTTLIVLIAAAVVSLIVGMYDDPKKGWIEGAAILFAVLLVACVTATNDYNKDAQFRKLNAVKEDVTVTVMRNGKITTISIRDILVGDVVQLNTGRSRSSVHPLTPLGDKVPADGVLFKASDVKCDESALTGESKEKPKAADTRGGDPFMLSGSSVTSGYGFMVVTAVGLHSRWGKIKSKLTSESNDTPLQGELLAV